MFIFTSSISPLRKFLSDHDLGEVTLLGHSMGARAAMLLCLTDPSRVRDGISVDATPVHPTPRHGVDILREYLRALKKVRIIFRIFRGGN